MKKLCAGLVMASLVLFTGCSKSEPGGGSTSAEQFTMRTEVKEAMNYKLEPGEKKTFELVISRGSKFMDDITLEAVVDTKESGLTSEIEPKVYKKDNKDKVKLTLGSAKETKPGKYMAKVTGTPTNGKASPPLEIEFEVTAKK